MARCCSGAGACSLAHTTFEQFNHKGTKDTQKSFLETFVSFVVNVVKVIVQAGLVSGGQVVLVYNLEKHLHDPGVKMFACLVADIGNDLVAWPCFAVGAV